MKIPTRQRNERFDSCVETKPLNVRKILSKGERKQRARWKVSCLCKTEWSDGESLRPTFRSGRDHWVTMLNRSDIRIRHTNKERRSREGKFSSLLFSFQMFLRGRKQSFDLNVQRWQRNDLTIFIGEKDEFRLIFDHGQTSTRSMFDERKLLFHLEPEGRTCRVQRCDFVFSVFFIVRAETLFGAFPNGTSATLIRISRIVDQIAFDRIPVVCTDRRQCAFFSNAIAKFILRPQHTPRSRTRKQEEETDLQRQKFLQMSVASQV